VTRIEAAFDSARAEGRAALMPYMMAGYPDRDSSLAVAEAYAESADLVELGVPFSDPLADGPTIHAAATAALKAGATLETALEICRAIADRVPVVLMVYSNMILAADGPIRQGDLDVSAHRRGDADREEGAARGIAVHELLEWSARNGWREPAAAEELLAPVRAWLGSDFFAERVREVPSRAEVPLLVEVADTVLRGSIDLLVEQPGSPPLIVDYKTDRLGDSSPAERAAHYAVQRDIYAFAVSDARGATEVEVAYVFLERPDEPVVALLDSAAIAAGRKRIEEAIERIAGEDAA